MKLDRTSWSWTCDLFSGANLHLHNPQPGISLLLRDHRCRAIASCLLPSFCCYWLCLPMMDGQAKLTWRLVTYQGNLPVLLSDTNFAQHKATMLLKLMLYCWAMPVPTYLYFVCFSISFLVLLWEGQFECGAKRCIEREGLRSWEVNFAYVEHAEKKNALVKLRKLWVLDSVGIILDKSGV